MQWGLGRVTGRRQLTISGITQEFADLAFEGTRMRKSLPIVDGKVVAQDVEPFEADHGYWTPVFAALAGQAPLKVSRRNHTQIPQIYQKAKATANHVEYARLLFLLRNQFTVYDSLRANKGMAYGGIIPDMLDSLTSRLMLDADRAKEECVNHLLAVLIGEEKKPERIFESEATVLDGTALAAAKVEESRLAVNAAKSAGRNKDGKGKGELTDLDALRGELDLHIPIHQAIFDAIAARNEPTDHPATLLRRLLALDLAVRIASPIRNKIMFSAVRAEVSTMHPETDLYWSLCGTQALDMIKVGCPTDVDPLDYFNAVYTLMLARKMDPTSYSHRSTALRLITRDQAEASRQARLTAVPEQSDSSGGSAAKPEVPRPK